MCVVGARQTRGRRRICAIFGTGAIEVKLFRRSYRYVGQNTLGIYLTPGKPGSAETADPGRCSWETAPETTPGSDRFFLQPRISSALSCVCARSLSLRKGQSRVAG